MRWSGRLSGVALLGLTNFMALAPGCSASSSSRVQQSCDRGSRKDCTCDSGQTGQRTCDDAGVYGACSCVPGSGGSNGASGSGGSAGLGGRAGSAGSAGSDASDGSAGSTGGSGTVGSSGAAGNAGSGGTGIAGTGTGGMMADSGTGGTGAGGTSADAGDASVTRSCVVQLVAGSYDTCALKGDRSVWCWGGGNATPARIDALTQVVELASGTFHKCARKTDGTVWCWGANGAGQIGDGTTEPRDAPVQVKLADGRATFVQISAGGFSSCARLQGGSVWCWGANGAGQAGNGVLSSTASTPVQVTAVDSGLVAEVVAEGGHGCARLQSGALRCWGGNTDGELGVGSSDTSPRLTSLEVAVLGATVVRTSGRCAIKNDLTLWCWGLNTSGQVGDGSTTLRTGPVQISTLGSTVAEVTRTFVRTCARKSDGSVWCWGRNGDGGLGDGTINGQPCPNGECKPTPVRVSGISDAAVIASGIGHACASRNDGTTWCWGMNGQGQLGEGMIAGQTCSGGPCRPQAVRSLLTCP